MDGDIKKEDHYYSRLFFVLAEHTLPMNENTNETVRF